MNKFEAVTIKGFHEGTFEPLNQFYDLEDLIEEGELYESQDRSV